MFTSCTKLGCFAGGHRDSEIRQPPTSPRQLSRCSSDRRRAASPTSSARTSFAPSPTPPRRRSSLRPRPRHPPCRPSGRRRPSPRSAPPPPTPRSSTSPSTSPPTGPSSPPTSPPASSSPSGSPPRPTPSSSPSPPLPPASSSARGSFEFLVKRLPGTPSASLCDLRPGDLVRVGGSVVGRGFEVAKICDAREVLVFATGSGISPIRSLIESGFGENEKVDVSLFYGARNLQRMAYQERFSDWESRGIKIIPVLSRPDDQWTGQRGYVQNAFSRTRKVVNPSSMGAILCGHKQMTEDITRALVADGMSKDTILTNI